MAALLKIMDEHFGPTGAERRPAVQLRLASERTTAREIIRRRVDAELQALAEHRAAHAPNRSFLIDVEATSPEARLKTFLKRRPPRPEARLRAETERAFAAFDRQRFIMLFDERQIERLDEEVVVAADSQVVFLYLTPLRGG